MSLSPLVVAGCRYSRGSGIHAADQYTHLIPERATPRSNLGGGYLAYDCCCMFQEAAIGLVVIFMQALYCVCRLLQERSCSLHRAVLSANFAFLQGTLRLI